MSSIDEMKAERDRLSGTIIRNHMIWAMGAGFIPIPIADFVAIGAIQLDMVRQLTKVYGLTFKETEGKAVVSALTTSGLAKLGARAVIKLIPGFGQVVGGVTLAIFSGASTYALGEVFKRHFEAGGTILDFDVEGLKQYYDEKFEKGKEIAKKIRKEEEERKADEADQGEAPTAAQVADDLSEVIPPDDVVERLQQLAAMREQGVLTEDEFQQAKARVLGREG